MIKSYINNLAMNSWDTSVRFRWQAGDVGLWDNRSTWHSATFDYTEERRGDRASSLGERPYYDPNGKFKYDALAEEGVAR